jgi:hypothetical protein
MSEPNDDVFPLPASDPLATHGPWVLLEDQSETLDQRSAPLRAAIIQMFPFIAKDLQYSLPLPPAAVAHVVLAGLQSCINWGADDKALGFHALSGSFYDDEEDEDAIDVPGDHRCYINMAGCLAALDEGHEATDIMATLPLQMAQVATLVRLTGGKTPLEVFDELGDEAFDEWPAQIWNYGSGSAANAPGESQTEAWAHAAVDRWMAADPNAPQSLKAISSLHA